MKPDDNNQKRAELLERVAIAITPAMLSDSEIANLLRQDFWEARGEKRRQQFAQTVIAIAKSLTDEILATNETY